MSFIFIVLLSLISGIIGGMGMGGGTVLIPALTIFLGVPQRVAQAANVIAFLPMALFVLPKHKQSGLLKTDGVGFIIIPAAISALAFGAVMTVLPSEFLSHSFGLFLIALAIKGIFNLKQKLSTRK